MSVYFSCGIRFAIDDYIYYQVSCSIVQGEMNMKVIHKYKLNLVDEQTIPLPRYSTVLSAIAQHDAIVVYALVDTATIETHDKTFRIVGTGHHHKDHAKWQYLATVTTNSDLFVWHVFLEIQ